MKTVEIETSKWYYKI